MDLFQVLDQWVREAVCLADWNAFIDAYSGQDRDEGGVFIFQIFDAIKWQFRIIRMIYFFE